jgi:hypothetical protein
MSGPNKQSERTKNRTHLGKSPAEDSVASDELTTSAGVDKPAAM